MARRARCSRWMICVPTWRAGERRLSGGNFQQTRRNALRGSIRSSGQHEEIAKQAESKTQEKARNRRQAFCDGGGAAQAAKDQGRQNVEPDEKPAQADPGPICSRRCVKILLKQCASRLLVFEQI